MKVLVVFGTRPEALKMFPVVRAAKSCSAIELSVCVTGQHRQMLDQVLTMAGIKPDFDLNIMRENQSLEDIVAVIMLKFPDVLERAKPDIVLVQGDTTTAFATGLVSFFRKTPVGHVEAGLRSHNPLSPWPEEMNRKLLAQVSHLHFAPTIGASDNLVREGIEREAISVTGNTIIDALLTIRHEIEHNQALLDSLRRQFPFLDDSAAVILVTSHRRENLDGGIDRICAALKKIVTQNDVKIVFPVHSNPRVKDVVYKSLSGNPRIILIDPVDYRSLVYLMMRARLVLTDSGGIQEEAPSFGKPVLVMRDNTERMEGILAGTAILVGTDVELIVSETNRLMQDNVAYRKMSEIHNPYGDGRASERIIQRLALS
jgi:UDP-N-acetylglucosamine 2-epimerase